MKHPDEHRRSLAKNKYVIVEEHCSSGERGCNHSCFQLNQLTEKLQSVQAEMEALLLERADIQRSTDEMIQSLTAERDHLKLTLEERVHMVSELFNCAKDLSSK